MHSVEMPSHPSSGGKAARVLVVEDERVVALALQLQLEGLGYEVVGRAASGDEALAIANDSPPDLVLMDINLQGPIDGVETAARLRQRQRVPIVYLTAYSNHEIVARAKCTHPLGYLLKPYEERELAIVVEMALYRHAMERAVVEQRRLLEATLRSIGDGVAATDREGRITLLNAAAEAMTGWSEAEARGRPAAEVLALVHEQTGAPVALPLERALRDRDVVPLDNHTCLQARDGRHLAIEDRATPITDDGGEVLGGVMVFQQVEARREAERARAQLAAIVASSDDAIIGLTTRGVISSWNQGAERLYGYQASEAIGQPASLVVPADKQAELTRELEQVERGERVPAYETQRLRKDGTHVEVSITFSPVRDAEGRLIGAAKIVRDVSHLRRLEGQLREAKKMEAITRLAGGIAHDFNNLLQVIEGNIDLVRAYLPEGSPGLERLAMATAAGDRARGLVRHLMAYSRQGLAQAGVMDLNEFLRGQQEALRGLLGEGIELTVILAETTLPIKINHDHLEQVLRHLASNARDAMPTGGRLTVEAHRVQREPEQRKDGSILRGGAYALLRVSDTGTGMTEDVLDHLFEPFFTTKPVGQGTGLGLAAVYGLVRQVGGNIKARSRRGAGATFEITFPLAEGEPVSAPAAPAAAPPVGKTILLVEDEKAVRALTSHLLSLEGHQVLAADRGAAAVELARTHTGPIDLLLVDVRLPDMTGPKVVEAVRAIRPEVRVLYQSGYTSDYVLDENVRAGSTHFMQKPFTRAELAHKVREALGS